MHFVGSRGLGFVSPSSSNQTIKAECEHAEHLSSPHHTSTTTPSTASSRERKTSHVELADGDDGGIIMDIHQGVIQHGIKCKMLHLFASTFYFRSSS